MLYVPICDETNKLESIRLKVKDEIKGENVRLISFRVGPTAHRAPDPRPDRGRPTAIWLTGPCHAALHKEVGAGGTQYEVHRVASLPTENPDPI